MSLSLLRRSAVVFGFLFISVGAQAALNLADPIPIGPQVEKGQLANGLTYYLQKNNRPENSIELRLVVKAGSILEDDDQRGLAHLLEHMAFNGSKHFKKNELISALQSMGMKFGADLNAYTSFNETVYTLTVPTNQPETIDKAFLVLQDWAGGLTLDDEAINAERAVVLEEMRRRKGVQDRFQKVLLPKLLGGQYAQRLPIGTEDSIKEFKTDAVKRFYKDWYRPNLMAVVVVGNMAPAEAKARIQAHFSALQNPQPERPRTYPALQARTNSEAVVLTDKEATNNIVRLAYPTQAFPPPKTLSDYRKELAERLTRSMLNLRLIELTQQAAPPFLDGGVGFNTMAPGYRILNTSVVLGRGGVTPAVDALIQENERARQFGFTQAELNRVKTMILRGMERQALERDKTNSGTYAAEYIRNFLVQEYIPGIDAELAYLRELLPTITVADVNQTAAAIIPHQSSKLVAYLGTDNADTPPPTQATLLEAVEQAQQRKVTAHEEKAIAKTLMAQPPKGGSIVAEQHNATLGTTELTFSNGVKAILKPTDFKNDQILLGSPRLGGQNLYGEADLFNARYATQLAKSMGIGAFAPLDLSKVLAGKTASLTVGLSETTEWVSGSASPADVETMLQLLHLRFGKQRRDADLYQSFISRSQDASKNALSNPQVQFGNALRATLFSNHPRVALTPRPEDFAKVDLNRVSDILDERFSSAKGFTFVLVGNLDLTTLKPLLATYLGSLPAGDITSKVVDLGVRPVAGVVKKEVRAGQEQKSVVTLTFAGAADYSNDENLRVQAMNDVLNLKIYDVLRQKLTLIYTGGIGGGLQRAPFASYQLTMGLPCAPENVDKVIAAAWGEIEKLQNNGPDAAELDKVKQNWLVEHRKRLRENGHWLNILQDATVWGDDPTENLLRYEARVAAITAADVQAAAKRYLRRDKHVQVVLLPASPAAAAEAPKL